MANETLKLQIALEKEKQASDNKKLALEKEKQAGPVLEVFSKYADDNKEHATQ